MYFMLFLLNYKFCMGGRIYYATYVALNWQPVEAGWSPVGKLGPDVAISFNEFTGNYKTNLLVATTASE